ncbi:MAG: hypothetical protein VW985_12845, partial [Gammaproteobacteria bacterium]
FYPEETPVGSAHGKILRAAGKQQDSRLIESRLEALQAGLKEPDEHAAAMALRRVLAELVPSLPVEREVASAGEGAGQAEAEVITLSPVA